MAKPVKVYTPKVTASIMGGGELGISGASITLRIGGWASASVSFHPPDADGQATKVFSKDVAQVLGQLQKKGFEDRFEADAKVTMSDGAGGNLMFNGLTTAPGFTMMPGVLARTVELVHAAALIDGIDSGIYNLRGALWDENQQNIGADSWSMFIYQAFELLFDKGRYGWDKLNPLDAAVMDQKHRLNGKLEPILSNILNVSAKTTGSQALTKMMANSNTVLKNSIGLTLLSYFGSCREGFWGFLNQMCSAFQLIYIPPTGDDYGMFIRLQDALTAAPVSKELSLTQCGYSSQASSVLPLQQVLITVSGASLWAFGNTTDLSKTMAVWPKSTERSTGQVFRTSLPAWLIPKSSMDVTKARPITVTLKAPGADELVSIEAYKGKDALSKKVEKASDELLNEFASEYTRALYIDRCLAGSSFTVTTPLDVTWRPGTRYSVTDGGAPLFTGFLAMVQHTAQVEPGQGQARTKLDFTHVELGDFKLPGA